MICFEPDPGLSDAEMDAALRAIADYLKQHPEFACANIRLNRLFVGAEVSAPIDRFTPMMVTRGPGGRWTIAEQKDPPPHGGLANFLDQF